MNVSILLSTAEQGLIYSLVALGLYVSFRTLDIADLTTDGSFTLGIVTCTALTAAGAHLILFSTGRGTPFGAPAPTLKIATNSQLAAKKANWIDFNAGVVADGQRTLDEAGEDLYRLVLEVASGKQTCAEGKGFREISIFKDGVVL